MSLLVFGVAYQTLMNNGDGTSTLIALGGAPEVIVTPR
jgi:hypothetical protein